MKTLKKALCLVLALAMVFSFCAINVSADFADEESITYKEAVDVMSALGIIEGTDSGNFDPTGSFTRAAAAKIIAYMMLGDLASTLDAGNSSVQFADCKGHWASGYIAYCASEGIISGDGTGNFNPGGALSLNAWLKMLLGAMGKDTSALTGPSWELSTARAAIEAGIIENSDIGGTFNREVAVKDAFAAMQIGTEYQEGWDLVVNDNGKETVYTFDTRTEALLYAAILSGHEGVTVGVPTHNTVAVDSIMADVYATYNLSTQDGYGKTSKVWYTDVNGNQQYNRNVDTLLNDGKEYLTDTVLGEFAYSDKLSSVYATIGSEKNVEVYVNGVRNGSVTPTKTTDTRVGAVAGVDELTSNVFAELVLSGNTYKLLYHQEQLVYITRGARGQRGTDDANKYHYIFRDVKADKVIDELGSALYDNGTFTNGAYYNITISKDVDTEGKAAWSVIDANPAESLAGKVSRQSASTITVDSVQYNHFLTDRAGINYTDTFAFYKNSAGDIVLWGRPDSVGISYDGIVYVTSAQYSTTGTSQSLFGDASLSVSARAKVLTADNTVKTVDLPTRIEKGKAQFNVNGKWETITSYNTVNDIFTTDSTGKATTVLPGWYGYIEGDDGSYTLYTTAVSTGVVGANEKSATIVVGGDTYYLTSASVLSIVNYEYDANKDTESVSSTSVTGSGNVTAKFAEAISGTDRHYVLNADNRGVVKSLTVYNAGAVAAEGTSLYALYEGPAFATADGLYYEFLVVGEDGALEQAFYLDKDAKVKNLKADTLVALNIVDEEVIKAIDAATLSGNVTVDFISDDGTYFVSTDNKVYVFSEGCQFFDVTGEGYEALEANMIVNVVLDKDSNVCAIVLNGWNWV